MSAYPITDHIYPPVYSKRFTSFASQLVLHEDTANGGAAPVVAKPIGPISWLPCQVVVEVAEADIGTASLSYIDGGGAAVSMTFPAAGVYVLRMAPTSIETATADVAVTVFWSQKG